MIRLTRYFRNWFSAIVNGCLKLYLSLSCNLRKISAQPHTLIKLYYSYTPVTYTNPLPKMVSVNRVWVTKVKKSCPLFFHSWIHCKFHFCFYRRCSFLLQIIIISFLFYLTKTYSRNLVTSSFYWLSIGGCLYKLLFLVQLLLIKHQWHLIKAIYWGHNFI